MGVGVGKLYLHTVRPATATQSGQIPRRMPVPSQAADTHVDKPQTDTQSDHKFTQSGNKGGRMQNQTNKSCTWSDHTRGQARSQTSDTGVRRDTHAEAWWGGQHSCRARPAASRQVGNLRNTARQGAHPAGLRAAGKWGRGPGLRCAPDSQPDPLTHGCVHTDDGRAPGTASWALGTLGAEAQPSSVPLRGAPDGEGGGPSWLQGDHGSWPHPRAHICGATSGEAGSVLDHLGQLGGPQRASGETKGA